MLYIFTYSSHPGALFVGVAKAVAVFGDMYFVGRLLFEAFCVGACWMAGCLGPCGCATHLLHQFLVFVFGMKRLAHRLINCI